VPPLLVRSASGVRIRTADHGELVDGMSSWWAAIHGYQQPALDTAVAEQLRKMAHTMFGGLTHEPGVRLATRLVEITPAPLQHVFFSDSGSVAVEVALKMCLQYWRAEGQPSRSTFLTVRGGYYGDTFGAMSLCDPVGGMHHLFADVLPKHQFADRPPAGFSTDLDETYVAHLSRLISEHGQQFAAVVIEPVVQGAGGMHFYSPGYVRLLRELCDQYDVLLVLDEIATGFGRTGALFAAAHADVAPDVMCVGKAMTGGYMSMAATLCTSRIADAISKSGVLNHGPTFMGNPLAAAVSTASIDLLLSGDWQTNVHRIEGRLRQGLAAARDLPNVQDVRVLGAVGVLQLNTPVDVAAATRAALDAGVWLRPFRDLIYTMPPYICTDDEVDTITAAMLSAAAAVL
jgi:adenosylmethionine-8-amino-7-oxononanoate aminotransferase